MNDLTDAAREAQRAYMREWRKRNPERVREKNRRYWERRAQEKGGAAGAEEKSDQS